MFNGCCSNEEIRLVNELPISGKFSANEGIALGNGTGNNRAQSLPPIRFHIVAYDYGIKRNILRLLRQKGFRVTVVPAGPLPGLNPENVGLIR